MVGVILIEVVNTIDGFNRLVGVVRVVVALIAVSKTGRDTLIYAVIHVDFSKVLVLVVIPHISAVHRGVTAGK